MNFTFKVLLNVLVFLSLGALVYILQNEKMQYKLGSKVSSTVNHNNLWFIFTKANKSYKLRQNIKRFAKSLLENTSIPLSLHVISDYPSETIVNKVLESELLTAKTPFTWQHHNVSEISASLENITVVMQQHFSSQPGAYYGDALFFISTGLHRVTSQSKAIMMDVDVELKVDVALLFEELISMPEETLIAAAPEQTPVYRHVLHMYRAKHRSSKFGEPLTVGGNPGVNSGVLLLNLERQRSSPLYRSLLTKSRITALCDKYQFHGHLGDQDWYTLLSQEYPSLVHFLDCTWNRQLCLWWRHHGYHDIFDLYHHCEGKPRIYHGNCNTDIPNT